MISLKLNNKANSIKAEEETIDDNGYFFKHERIILKKEGQVMIDWYGFLKIKSAFQKLKSARKNRKVFTKNLVKFLKTWWNF